MKARFFALAALVLGLASCQQEFNGAAPVGGEVDFQLSVAAPELGTTRATDLDGDEFNGHNSAYGAIDYLENDWGKVDLRYTLEVFDAKADYSSNEVSPVKDRQVIIVDKYEPVTFDLRLVPNREYRFVVFADFVDQGASNDPSFATQNELGLHYSLGYDLRTITVKEDKDAINQEYTDAYFDYEEFTISNSAAKDMVLTRPFGKVRVIATDLDQLNINVDPGKVVVTYDEAHVAAFNAVTGDIDKNQRLARVVYENVYAEEATKENLLAHYYNAGYDAEKVANANNVERHKYMTLFTDYILAEDSQHTIHFTMEVFDKAGTPIKKTHFNTDIPVQRNNLTTIVGNVLTTATEINVTIDDSFEGKHDVALYDWKGEIKAVEEKGGVYEIYEASELAWLAKAVNEGNTFAGKTVKLCKDIHLNDDPWTPIGFTGSFEGTFDGQGHKIAHLFVCRPGKSNVGLFGTTKNGEIKNLVVECAYVKGRLNVGVVAGNPYTSKFTDITVCGDVKVEGMAYVGGVGGKNAYADWTNVTVNANAGSYVKANSVENGTAYRTYVGGVVGFNGEGGHKFENITSNINVEGTTCDVGGLFGIAHYDNKFVNCSCSGNVEITGADESADAQEIGGIAGVWHNATGHTVTLDGCEFTGTLKTNKNVKYYYRSLIGKPYGDGEGKLYIDGVEHVANAAALQRSIDAIADTTTIRFGYDINGDAMIQQKSDINVILDGCEYKYDGSIKIHNGSNYNNAEILIENVAFETSTNGINFVMPNEFGVENGVTRRYSQNITVTNCSFKALGDAKNTAVGVQAKSAKNVQVINCKATNMHSLIQAQSCGSDVVVKDCTVNGKNGVAFKQVQNAVVENTTIKATEYGIRYDGNIDNYGIVVKNNKVNAKQPFIVRKMTGKDNTITLEGENTFTTDEAFQVVITNGSDDEAYSFPTGTYTLTGAEGFNVYPIDTPYALAAAIANDKLAEVEMQGKVDLVGEGFEIKRDVVLDFANYELNAGSTPSSYWYALEIYGNEVEINNANFTRAGVHAGNDAKVVFNNGVINHKPERSSRYIFCAQSGSTITIKNGEFSNDRPNNSYFWADAATIIVEGGNFGGSNSTKKVVLTNGGQVIIKGGTFNFDPTTYLAEGYQAVKSGSTWTVSAI